MESLQQECIIEEVTEDGTSDSPAPAKSSSKDSKKANGAHAVAVSLAFKITNKVLYKTVLKDYLLLCGCWRSSSCELELLVFGFLTVGLIGSLFWAASTWLMLFVLNCYLYRGW
ncbi:uncharacterized protein LOC131057906 isoform X2 [Cryptomeria japonica]|uniref:uncharacterized protein LOC131057906 isoform X2 n=1 Tax=Cryptomeria japonica TaxID=3369 RepID=UPI0027DA2175|nr:uncharacterized protein LOC131057906 isoform X2 [Cryptomeria japonica]